MKTILLLQIAALLGFPMVASAQDETAHHRAVLKEINESEKSLKKVTGKVKDEISEFTFTGYLDKGLVKKIVAVSGDADEGVAEYYLEGEKPLFIYHVFHPVSVDGKRGAKAEERLYFKDGKIFKWLTTEVPAPVFQREDYEATTELHRSRCVTFVAALKGQGAAKAAASPVAEGVFGGIEEGDYPHWNMRDKEGKELSFFVLKPDASVEKVLGKPEAYAGKKCRVTWKKSLETIPEIGGEVEIEQVLSVEWLDK